MLNETTTESKVLKVIGSPGTGKTTYLLAQVADALAAGVSPAEIMYITFTKKAINEALDRFTTASGYMRSDFPWFKTLHAFAFFALGLDKKQVLTEQDITNFLPHLSEDMLDRVQALHQRRTLTGETIDQAAARMEGEDPINRLMVEEYEDALAAYKKATGQVDFNDMLTLYLERPMTPPLALLVVDEAQDLSALQWAVVDVLAASAERVLLAGDPAQAIFEWAGAGTKIFEQREGDPYVLPKSHRVPRRVQALADRVRNRFIGDFYGYTPVDRDGEVHHLPPEAYGQVPFSNGESWLVLARTWRGLERVRSHLWKSGVPWKAAGRYISSQGLDKTLRHIEWYERAVATGECTPKRAALLANHVEDLVDCIINRTPWYEAFSTLSQEDVAMLNACMKDEAKVTLSTIHAAKGGEADNVLIEGQTTQRVEDAWRQRPEEEGPVLYVALTRTKNRLYLMESPTGYGYPWGQLIGGHDGR